MLIYIAHHRRKTSNAQHCLRIAEFTVLSLATTVTMLC